MNIHRYSLPNQICIDLHSKTAPSTLSFSKFLPSKLIFFHYKKCLTTAVTGSTIKSTFYIIRMSSKVECKAAGSREACWQMIPSKLIYVAKTYCSGYYIHIWHASKRASKRSVDNEMYNCSHWNFKIFFWCSLEHSSYFFSL